MSEPVRQRYSFAEYLELEAISAVKHEFIHGHVWALAGDASACGDRRQPVVAAPRAAPRKTVPSVFFRSPDSRAGAGLGTYPDVSVVCGSLQTAGPADA